MLFNTFNSQEERRSYGGSAFIEIQFCKLPPKTKINKLVAVNSIKNWQNDSLYVYQDDINIFYEKYSHILNCGIYNNLKSGVVDIYGINYYAPDLKNSIIEKLYQYKPIDYIVFVQWLNKADKYNGFYVLGI